MKRSLRRAESLLCVLALCIGLLPSTALAKWPGDGPGDGGQETQQTVYVYIKIVDSNGNELTEDSVNIGGTTYTVNEKGWYTIGTIQLNLPNPDGYNDGNYKTALTSNYKESIRTALGNIKRYEENQGLISDDDLKEKAQFQSGINKAPVGLKAAWGANGYSVKDLCWHLDMTVPIRALKQYIVTYKDGAANGSSFEGTKTTVLAGTAQVGAGLDDDIKSPTWEGYTFTGWKMEGDDSGNLYYTGESYVLTKHTTFVAQWEKNPNQGTVTKVEVYINDVKANASQNIEVSGQSSTTGFVRTSDDGADVYEFTYQYEQYDCADINISLKDAGKSYVVQAIEAELIGGENGSAGIGKTEDGTYTLDNVVGGSTVKVYLYLPYEVRYYKDSDLLTENDYKDTNTYVASEKASSGDVPESEGTEATEITWVDGTYKTSIALAGLPAGTSGWYLGSESGTKYDPSTATSVMVSEVKSGNQYESNTGKWYIPFYALTEEVKYAAGYFVLVPSAIPDDFDPTEGYSVDTYLPNTEGDTVTYENDANHKVDNTTGYIGYITQAAVDYWTENKDSDNRVKILADKILDFLRMPEGAGWGKVWTEYLSKTDEYGNALYTLVPYQINNHTLGANWPDTTTQTDGKYETKEVGYHVDCYIQGVEIDVVYAKNDGSAETYIHDTVNEKPIRTGDTYTVLGNDGSGNNQNFIREGYTFTGWNTQANGSGTTYAAGEEISPLMNSLVLYAQWKKDDDATKTLSYTVEYYKDGEKVEGDTQAVTEKVWINSEQTTLTVKKDDINIIDKYEGYTFEKTDPATIPETIENGGVIKVYYVKADTPDYTVTIQPADITVYTGGKVYGGVTDANGNLISELEDEDIEASGLPEPGYHLELSDDVIDWLNEKIDIEGVEDGPRILADYLTFTYDVNGVEREWALTYMGVYATDENGQPTRYVYSLEPGKTESGGTIPVRILYFVDSDNDGEYDEGETAVSDDDFLMGETSVFEQYTMIINPGELEQENIKAQFKVGDETIEATVKIDSGTLTIRSTTNAEDVNGIEDSANGVDQDTITAVENGDVTYYVNDSEVTVYEGRVGLLVDEVSNDAGYNYAMAQDAVGHAITSDETDWTYRSDLSYEMAYMDLVDTQNGNAMVTMGENDSLTIYWPMPDDADPYGDFHVVHYTGMDRESIVGEDDLDSTAKEILTGKAVRIDGQWYVAFATGSFSPFVLVYETESGYVPPIDPPDPGTDDDEDDEDDSPDDLNTEDHYAYLIGFTDGTIRPEAEITRAEVATIFFRLLTDEAREQYWSQTNPYPDVDSDDWYNNAISTLTNMGILTGKEDGAFHPLDSITKAEFATIAVRFFDYTAEYRSGTFLDVESGTWYADYVQAASDMGLIEGNGLGYFEPMRSITRAEAATIVNRTLGRAPHEDHLLPWAEMNVWPDNSNTQAWYYAAMQEATNSHDYTWTTEDGEDVEEWTEKLEERDWAALEQEWSDADSAPGGEVVD